MWVRSLGQKDPSEEEMAIYSSVLFYLFIYFIFKLYIIVLVLPNIKMNLPRVYMCSPSWTLLPPPSPFHPSGSSQCTSPKHPVSCIEPGLATHFIYNIIHSSMPFSQIIPPSPSPITVTHLFCNWKFVCLFKIYLAWYLLDFFLTGGFWDHFASFKFLDLGILD